MLQPSVLARHSRTSFILALCFAATACSSAAFRRDEPAGYGRIGESLVGAGARVHRTEINRELSHFLGAGRSRSIPREFYATVERVIGQFTSGSTFASMLEKEAEYGPMIRGMLREHGLPEDLVYLALIESGFRPSAVSHAGATGMWQFMSGTARDMNLRVDSWVDERRDPVRSTEAALKYLAWLYSETSDWALAAAAYNAGLGRVQRTQKSTGENDYFVLAARGHLPRETAEYVPRIVAASIIGHDPARFGLRIRRPRQTFSYQGVKVPMGASLRTIARITRVSLAELERLNPHLLKGQAPPDTDYVVWFPSTSRVDEFEKTIREGVAQERRRALLENYEVRPGDSMYGLAKKYGLRIEDILRWNNMNEPRKLLIGERLRLAPPQIDTHP